MRQTERKKEKDKVAIVLVLCFCVIALTSIFTIRSNINKINGSGTQVPVSDPAPSVGPQKPSAGDTGEEDSSNVSSQVPTVDSLEEGSSNSGHTQNAQQPFFNPVNAPDSFISNEYAMDSLVYSVTLDQYMTHSGIDIEAPADTQVLSMADGIVTAVYNDDRYGNTIEIRHGNQFTAVYANLSDAHMVETGDTVKAQQIIGGVGTTGLFESLEPAHLHLELLKDGVYVNPTEYIAN